MPDDATEGVAEHSSRLQPSINLHAPVTAFMFSCSGTQCTTPKGWRLDNIIHSLFISMSVVGGNLESWCKIIFIKIFINFVNHHTYLHIVLKSIEDAGVKDKILTLMTPSWFTTRLRFNSTAWYSPASFVIFFWIVSELFINASFWFSSFLFSMWSLRKSGFSWNNPLRKSSCELFCPLLAMNELTIALRSSLHRRT